MFISISSDNVALLAIAGGTSAAFFNSAIENLLDKFLLKSSTVANKVILQVALLSAVTVGLLLIVIFYAFALYGFPEKNLNPIELIAIFTIFWGLGYPLLGGVVKVVNRSIYSRFKAKS